MSVREYTLAFDWSRSGGFGGTLEDVSSYVSADEIILTVGRKDSRAASVISQGTLGFNLIEKDDPPNLKFAPESITSPIAGKVIPGTPGKLLITISGSTTTLFSGVLEGIAYDPGSPATLTGQLMDSWGRPSAEKLSTAVWTGMRTGDLIGVVLDSIGWTGPRDIDPGATLVPFWWEEGTDAATAIQKLVDSEGTPAVAFVEGGVFVFRDRHHRVLRAASLTSQGTFTHIFPAGSGPAGDFKILKDSFSYDHGRGSIVNTATFNIDIRTPDDFTPVWSTDSPISVAAGATVVINVSASDPFINAITPVPVTSLDLNGNPLNGDYVLAYGSLASISLSRTSGQSLLLTIVGGGTDSLLTMMQVRANALTVDRTQKVSVSDPGSVAGKGTLTWPGEDPPWAGVHDATAIAQRIVSTYAAARPVMTFDIECSLINSSGVPYLTQFANRRVSDRVTVRHDLLGFNGDCHVEQVERVLTGLGLGPEILRLTVEPVAGVGAVAPLTFGVAGRGFNDGQFDIDGVDNVATVFRFDTAGQGFDQGRFGS